MLRGEGEFALALSLPSGESETFEVSAVAGRKTGELTSNFSVETSGQRDSNPQNNSTVVVVDAPLRSIQHGVPTRVGRATPCLDDVGIAGGELFFVGGNENDFHGRECHVTRAMASSGPYAGHLWKTNSTASGTVLVRQFSPPLLGRAGPLDAFDEPEFTQFRDIIYFAVDDHTTGRELWRSDGTTEGTWVVKDIQSEPELVFPEHVPPTEINPSSAIGNLGATKDYLLFAADDGIHGRELWRTDGTTEGTQLLMDIRPGSTTGYNRHWIPWRNRF